MRAPSGLFKSEPSPQPFRVTFPRRNHYAAYYRAFELDRNRHIVGKHDLFCRDDESAKEQAARLVDGYDVELWQGERRIAFFKRKAGPA
jgi:hypothetical protein